MFNKSIFSAALILASTSAFAVPQDLTFDVVANVPTTSMSLTPQGGWTSIALPYDVLNTRLRAATKQLDVRTDGSKDLEAWLQTTGAMQNGSGDNIDLAVSINSVALGVGQANKVTILPAPVTTAPVIDLIPITVTPATGTHLAGNYNGQLTVVYDLAP